MVISVWACQSLQLSLTLCGHMDCSQSAPLSIGFSMQEYWSGLPCLPPGDLPVLGMEPVSLMSPALAGSFFTTSATWEALYLSYFHCGLQGQIHLENSLFIFNFLEKGMAIHSGILVWRIPWTEKPGRLQSVGLQRVGHD